MFAIITRRLAGTALIAAAASLALGGAAQAAPQVQAGAVATTVRAVPAYTPPAGVTDPCPATSPDTAGCATLVRTRASRADKNADVITGAAESGGSRTTAHAQSAAPGGLSPANLRAAYNLQGASSGSGQTVAVVTAYNDPNAASDLAVYRSEYGLTPCTVADGCFKQVNESGGSSLPGTALGWSASAAESMDAISGICPNCHILLVEASDTGISNLGAAENEAVALGAKVIDNDWTMSEINLGSEETAYDADYFDHPGVAITAPAGDNGYGVISYPAASRYVTAVGGTTLTADSSSPTGYTETAWAGSSSGCSAYEPKPAWQTDTGCAGRTLNDLAADAGTPVAFYDTPTEQGWSTALGTAVAAAIVAAEYALAGTPASGTYPAAYPYEHPGGSYTTPGNAYPYVDGLTNITSGSDGTCPVSYLCTAGAGYNGPTGLGSPNTTLALTAAGAQTGVIYAGIQTMCLDNDRGTAAAGNKVQVYQCNGGASQDWTIQPDGTVRFDGSYCLYVSNAGTSAGDPVELGTCSTTDGGMLWIPRADGTLYNPRSGMYLYDPDGIVNSTQVEIDTCNGASRTQQWPLPYSNPSATGPITSQVSSSLCLDDDCGATTDGNKIQVYSCNGGTNQDWTVEPGGTLRVLSGCMTANGNTGGALIVWDSCTGTESQYWIIRSDGSMWSPSAGCAVDPNGSTTLSTQLQIGSCGGAGALWKYPS